MFQVKAVQHFSVLGALAAALLFGGCAESSNRDDFAAQLKNKTEAEVVKYAGKPAEVDAAKPERTSWIYKSRTFDVGTRKTDPTTTVIFSPSPDGKLHVVEVLFE